MDIRVCHSTSGTWQRGNDKSQGEKCGKKALALPHLLNEHMSKPSFTFVMDICDVSLPNVVYRTVRQMEKQGQEK